MVVSGFEAANYCMEKHSFARIACGASKKSCPVRQLIGQVSGLGDGFVVYN